MVYTDNGAKDLKIAYIGGGSRNWAWCLMADLAKDADICGEIRLFDIDKSAAEDNSRVGNALAKREEVKSAWTYKVADTIGDALTGADFVVISILPGTFEEMRSDVHLPEEYGIYQSVGDTVGPAGILRGLRSVPLFLGFAREIERYAPNAWVINYTNPMTLCTRALYEGFPGIKAFGCCHEVMGFREAFMSALKDIRGIEVKNKKDIKMNVLGINHFTWIDRAYYQNIDLMPLYMEFAKKYAKVGFSAKSDDWVPGADSAYMVVFDMALRYGIIATGGDRHLAEFVPWYLTSPEAVNGWKFNLTTVDERIKGMNEAEEERQQVLAGERKLDLEWESGEEGVEQIKSLIGLCELVTNVNMPNRGSQGGIPLGAVVEQNAVFNALGVTPIMASALPDPVLSLVNRHVYNQETIIRAVVNEDKQLAFQALINDPLVNLPIDKSWEMFTRMLDNTKAYLPAWLRP